MHLVCLCGGVCSCVFTRGSTKTRQRESRHGRNLKHRCASCSYTYTQSSGTRFRGSCNLCALLTPQLWSVVAVQPSNTDEASIFRRAMEDVVVTGYVEQSQAGVDKTKGDVGTFVVGNVRWLWMSYSCNHMTLRVALHHPSPRLRFPLRCGGRLDPTARPQFVGYHSPTAEQR